jgi:D-alanyl-lipoteichoic acid acyltransferase DltB (MBOAT superfamily)
MVFNSFAFFVFFPVVTALYFLLPHRGRWLLLLGASCVFYAYFIPKYLLILGFTIVVDYFAGILIENAKGRRRRLALGFSIAANVGVLALFKYFNFFNENLAALSQFLGWNYGVSSLALILPIGLSFHTFQAMSYTIEVYRGNQKAERHFGIYALYVMFYPQLVAGPIERPQNLLHQFYEVHSFDYDRITSGLKLMAWGLFKKTVVADRLARFVDYVYVAPSQFNGPVLAVATVYFAFQIFYDFSGYTDIAIGAARVMGFELMRNFDCPYHAKSIAEFWRRWHISLSSWFRDYLYFPLGGNRVPKIRWYINIVIVFVVSGLWHGANWTYIIWGALHSFFLVFGAATQRVRAQLAQAVRLVQYPRVHSLTKVLATFLLVCFAWIFFRANSFHHAIQVCGGIASGWGDLLHPGRLIRERNGTVLGFRIGALLGVVVIELGQLFQKRNNVLARIACQPWWFRWSLYYGIVAAIFFFHVRDGDRFIYFQF